MTPTVFQDHIRPLSVLFNGSVVSNKSRLLALKARCGRLTMFSKKAFVTLLVAFFCNAFSASDSQAGYAAYVVDVETGTILHQKNARTPNFPASLTKMMTLYLVFESLQSGLLSIDEKMPVSKKAAAQPPTKLGLKPGQSIRVKDAISALAVKSANDVATVVAERLGGTEPAFARRMTNRARALGMTATTFRNSSGLPNKKQITTAYDMSVLTRALYRDFPQHMHFFSAKTFTFRGKHYRNHNRLLGQYKGMNGVKTGYTAASGFNLAASVNKNGHHVVAIVMGGKTAKRRNNQMRRLLDRAFAGLEQYDRTFAGVARPAEKPSRDMIALAHAGVSEVATGARKVAQELGDQLTRVVGIPPAAAQGAATAGTGADALLDKAKLTPWEWGIQVGAFRSPQAARTELDRAMRMMPHILGGTKSVILSIPHSNIGTLYRARWVGLLESQARQACEKMGRFNLACVVTPPSPRR